MISCLWILFVLVIVLLLYIDLKANQQHADFSQAVTWTGIWIAAALLFNVAILWLYGDRGAEAALAFFTGYLIEKMLSLDNIFVMALIFSYFSVPLKLQHRVLFWGVFGAILLRFLMITFGLMLFNQFTWMNYLFGALLIWTAIKILVSSQENIHPERNLLIRCAKKFFPILEGYQGSAFFVRINGVLWMTPLFLVLLLIETSDALFALDSVPAIFAITRDPFLVFTSNIFAVLGLRSLYFVLATALSKSSSFRLSLVFLLAFVGVKLLLVHSYPIDTLHSLAIIVAILLLAYLKA